MKPERERQCEAWTSMTLALEGLEGSAALRYTRGRVV